MDADFLLRMEWLRGRGIPGYAASRRHPFVAFAVACSQRTAAGKLQVIRLRLELLVSNMCKYIQQKTYKQALILWPSSIYLHVLLS